MLTNGHTNQLFKISTLINTQGTKLLLQFILLDRLSLTYQLAQDQL